MSVQRASVRILGVLAVALALGHGSVARADMLYDFDYTVVTDNGGGTNYSGQLDVSGTTVIGITGVASTYGEITGLVPVNGYAVNDNEFSPISPYLTFFGVSFSVDGHGDSNLFDDPVLGWSEYNNSSPFPGPPKSSGILTVTAAPEPISIAVFATGLAALSVGRMFHRRKVRPART
jgi:hypothetical protein